MEQIELLRIAKRIENMYFEPWHLRDPKLPKVMDYPGGYEAWYDNFINVWIPGQKDSTNLMTLFILCGFDPVSFLKIIVSPTPPPKKNQVAA